MLVPSMLSRFWRYTCVVHVTKLQLPPKILGLFCGWFVLCALAWAESLLG